MPARGELGLACSWAASKRTALSFLELAAHGVTLTQGEAD